VPGAVEYIISSPGVSQYIECDCINPVDMIPITTSNTYAVIPGYLLDKCFLWQVTAVCGDGHGTMSPPSAQVCQSIIIKKEDSPRFQVPNTTGTTTIYPNPSSGKMTISVNINYNSDVHIELYDMLGHKVNYFNKTIQAEANKSTSFNWNGTRDLAKGVYFIRFQTNVESFTKTIVIE